MNFVSLLLLTSVAFFFYVGFDLSKEEKYQKENIFLIVICGLCCWWSFSFAFIFAAPDYETAWRWLNLSYPGWFYPPAFILHFCLTLSGVDMKLGKWIYPLLYLPPTLFLFLAWGGNLTEVTYTQLYGFSGGTQRRENPLGYWSFSFYYMLFCIIGSYFLYRWGKKTDLKGEKQKSKIIIISTYTSITLVFVVGTLLPGLDIQVIPRVPSIMIIPWIAGIWFAMTRYQFQVLTTSIAADEVIFSIQDLLLMVSSQGKIIRANHRASRFLSYREEEILGWSPLDFLPEKGATEVSGVLAGRITQFQDETLLMGKGYRKTPVRLRATSVMDKDGDLAGSILVFQDLTGTYRLREEAEKRREAEENLRVIHEELIKQDQQKTDFISMISHELRTPLTSILGFSSIIAKRFDQAVVPRLPGPGKPVKRALRQFRGNMEIIISEAERLTALINNVLDITRMESGRMDWKMGPLDIQEVIQQAAAATSSLFAQKGLPLVRDIPPGLPRVTGDRDRLVQVVINLLSNAVKFTHEGRVTCQVFREGDMLTVRVRDTGKGIPREDLEEVFQKFSQVKGTGREGYKGTGLGLPISREIVEYHGGRIWAQSTPGAGSTFSFTLPVEMGGKDS